MKITATLLGIAMLCNGFARSERLNATPPDSLLQFVNHARSRIDKANEEVEKENKVFARRVARFNNLFQFKLNRKSGREPDSIFQTKLRGAFSSTPTSSISSSLAYVPYLDSTQILSRFLQTGAGGLTLNKHTSAELNATLESIKKYEAISSISDKIKSVVGTKMEFYRSLLGERKQLSKSVIRQFQKINQARFEYAQKLSQYKQCLNSPDKLLNEALAVASKLPAFKTFASKNSQLAAMFPSSANSPSSLTIAGLQTKTAITSQLQGKIGVGSGASSAFTANMSQAKEQASSLTEKLTKYGSGMSDIQDPTFSPNLQAGKSLFNRLEYELASQSQPDIAGSSSTFNVLGGVGYKISASNVIGLGIIYRMGVGKPIKNVHFSSQGFGLRSYADVKIKKSFYLSGGFEYTRMTYTLPGGETQNLWQPAGLVGLSKVVQYHAGTIKKAKIQLLWNALSYTTSPITQHFMFRVAYAL